MLTFISINIEDLQHCYTREIRVEFVEFVELSILTHRSALYISDVSMPLEPSIWLVIYCFLVSYKRSPHKRHDLAQNRISWQFYPRKPKHFGQPGHDELYDLTKEIPTKQNVYTIYRIIMMAHRKW